jgi:hypothetical protein
MPRERLAQCKTYDRRCDSRLLELEQTPRARLLAGSLGVAARPDHQDTETQRRLQNTALTRA